MDSQAELDLIESKCRELGVHVAISDVWARGGAGAVQLAEEVGPGFVRITKHRIISDFVMKTRQASMKN